jgi:glutamine amidotransferase
MPFGAETVGPFVADGLAFAHNGYVEQFDRRVARPLTEDLPEDLFADLCTRTDSTALFALVRAVVRDRPAATLGDCLAEAVARTSEVVRDRGVSANLSCVLTNGRELVALRSAVGMPPNTLHASSTPDGLRVASEPLDDSSWTPLDPETVFTHDLLLPPSTP